MDSPVRILSRQVSLQEHFLLPQTLQLETNPMLFLCDQMLAAFPGKFP